MWSHYTSWFHKHWVHIQPERAECMHQKWQTARYSGPSTQGRRPGFPTCHLHIWNVTESSHKLNKDVWFKVSSDRLTVSKLPLCMSSMGGRKRSARVLSFLSTVPPLRSSCSWRTGKRRKNIPSHDRKLRRSEKDCDRIKSDILSFTSLRLGKTEFTHLFLFGSLGIHQI